MIIKSFEEIEGWQRARVLAKTFIEIVHSSRAMGYGFLFIQMLKCGNSAMANIAEGFDCPSDRVKIRFFSMSYRSVSEFQSHLYMAVDLKCLKQAEFRRLYDLATGTKDKIGGFIQYLQSCIRARDSGPRTVLTKDQGLGTKDQGQV